MKTRPSQYELKAHKRQAAREKARAKILKEANKVTRRSQRHLSKRHIYKAVQICRTWGLVKDKTLIEAGFRPVNGTGKLTPEKTH